MKDIGGLKSWQWMFLFESSPIILLGIITYLFLDNIPNAVQCTSLKKNRASLFMIVFENLGLNNIEKQLLTNLLRNDAGVADRDPASSTQISWRQVRYVFCDWRIYLCGLIASGNLGVIISLTTFLPTLMKGMGYSETEASLLTTPIYVIACVCCLLANYSSSCRNEHGFHIVFCLLIGLFGFILMLTLFDQGKVAIYVITTVTFCGIFSVFPLVLSWLANNIGGHTKRAMAISFAFGIAQIGAIFTPLVRVLRM